MVLEFRAVQLVRISAAGVLHIFEARNSVDTEVEKRNKVSL